MKEPTMQSLGDALESALIREKLKDAEMERLKQEIRLLKAELEVRKAMR